VIKFYTKVTGSLKACVEGF